MLQVWVVYECAEVSPGRRGNWNRGHTHNQQQQHLSTNTLIRLKCALVYIRPEEQEKKKHTQDRNWSVDSRWSCHNQYSLAWYRGCTWYSVPTTHGEDEHAGAPTLLEKFWRMTLLPSSMWHKISSNRGKWSKISSHRAVIASTVKCSNSVGILSTAAYRAHTGLCVQNVQVRVTLRVEAQKAKRAYFKSCTFQT